MTRPAFRTAAATAVVVIITAGQLHAISARGAAPTADPGFSPLFSRRLEVGLQNMDKPAEKIYMAGFLGDYLPVETPLSANPASLCLASGCFGSACLGSACLASACIGSACATSKCFGSACAVSVCGGSACAGSTCAGSACAGSVCVGSVCVGTACLGSACVGCTQRVGYENGGA